MGMNARLENLSRQVKKETLKRLESVYLRLVAPDQLGSIYKMFYIGKE